MIHRRSALALAAACLASRAAIAQPPAQEPAHAPARALAELEARHGGRLGVCLHNVASGRRVLHRGGERFAMCSTFKLLAAARILTQVDRHQESLERRIVFDRTSVVDYSPETEKHAGSPEGMTLGAICKAALTLSDNTAGNLMLACIGGPAGLTKFARAIGDTTTRLDRPETSLNEAAPGDPRDTTSPDAMARNLEHVLLGTLLAPASRTQITDWMRANTTGAKRLRAGIPPGWTVADKTGAGGNAQTNDIAVLWSPAGHPVIATVYYAQSPASDDVRNGVIAEVGRIASQF